MTIIVNIIDFQFKPNECHITLDSEPVGTIVIDIINQSVELIEDSCCIDTQQLNIYQSDDQSGSITDVV